MGMAERIRLLPVALLAALSFAVACGGDEQAATVTPSPSQPPPEAVSPAATPAPSLSPTPTPVTLENAVGPLFYYLGGPDHQQFLVAVDLATGTQVVNQPLERFTNVIMAGGRMAAWESVSPTEIVYLQPDGARGEPIYYAPASIPDASFSPDGQKLAIVLYREGVVVLDTATGDVITALNQYQVPLPADDGLLYWVQWLEDSEHLVIDLGVERDGCGPGHMSLALDGSFNFIEVEGCNHTSPNGRLMAEPGGYGCFLIGDDTVRIIDSLTGDEVVRYAEPRTVLTPWSWSPDSTEVLVRVGQVAERIDPREDCSFVDSEEFRASFSWSLLDVRTGELSAIGGLGEVSARWYPEFRVELECEQHPMPVLWSRFGSIRALCPDGFSNGKVTVDGIAVGEASTIEVLGFVER